MEVCGRRFLEPICRSLLAPMSKFAGSFTQRNPLYGKFFSIIPPAMRKIYFVIFLLKKENLKGLVLNIKIIHFVVHDERSGKIFVIVRNVFVVGFDEF